ncbi:hypothetical protein K0M31_007718 [Melipona bicolor]|uniref:Uncharacterized protein n=1 Tax=Melipona bicolor TaxID=60889 RepID=A0AA40GBZ1_9HYME|nr:hypothetical protein K0M31_007718 [Melipona bicolor]
MPVTHRTPRAVLNIKPINRRGGAVTDGRGHLATPPIDAESEPVQASFAVALPWREGEEGSCAGSAAAATLSPKLEARTGVQMRSGF